jgi:hypothetical protein
VVGSHGGVTARADHCRLIGGPRLLPDFKSNERNGIVDAALADRMIGDSLRAPAVHPVCWGAPVL